MKFLAAQEAEMVAHARHDFPNESCGVVIDGTYVPCVNVSDDPENEFKIDDNVMVEAYATGKLQAIIHSHPNGPNSPSKTDMEQQEASGLVWGIVYLNDAEGHKPLVFYWGGDTPIEPYEGRVFRHGIADCFALVRDWKFKEEGLLLPFTPRDDEWWFKNQNVVAEGILGMPCDEVPMAEMKRGDVLIAKVGSPVVNHTGIYLGGGLVLHHLSNRLSRIDVLGPWMKFVIKCVRTRPVQSVAQGGA
jgi:proteasome lid subunit RPN8/RPN11